MFWGKSGFQKKQRPLPGSLQTVVRSGETPQMVPFPKLGNWQFKIVFQSKINEFHIICPIPLFVSSENTRMSLPKIQEPPLNPLGKQIIMK